MDTIKRQATILDDQVVAGYILEEIQKKAAAQAARFSEIPIETASEAAKVHEALSNANEYIEKCRDFVKPENLGHVLGPKGTKHGEIAETLEVNFRNGRDVLNQLKASSRVLDSGSDRIGPTDYVINGSSPVQSKFINGGSGENITPNNSLRHILEHLKKYPGYANDATKYGFPGQHGIYHMPKDQYDILVRINNGDTSGLNHRTIESAKEFISQIERETGKPITEVVKPGLNTYSDVQLGRVDSTINEEEAFYQSVHDKQISEISEEEQRKLDEARHITDASWSDAFKAAGISAIISATTSAGIKIYSKIHSGKKICDFTTEDWKEIGVDFAKGGVKGGISGFSIYGLTKLGGFSAPFAGSVTTSAIGVASLYIDYQKGVLNANDFADSANIICFEAGFAAVGAAVGQAIIPIPILGAVVGSQVMNTAIRISESIVDKKDQALIDKMKKDYEDAKASIEGQVRKQISEIEEFYNHLGGLIEASMSKDINESLSSSIEIATLVGVPKEKIIHNEEETDLFMMS